jgi:hypothetical protein
VSNLHHAVHAGQSSPVGPCPEVAPEPPEPPPLPPGRRLGYSYDPIPSAIRGDRRLKPIDHLVLAILISFAVWRRDSCWTTIATIAARLPAQRKGRHGSNFACERTVQRSINRLILAAIIRRDRVSKPDLDDPKNRTGYRYYFLFVPVRAPDDQAVPSRAPGVQIPIASPSFAQAPTVAMVEDRPVQSPTGDPSAEMAKGSAEVAKSVIQSIINPPSGDRSEATSPDDEATSKSPDILVTQDRREFKKTEKTFNVANANGSAFAGTGDQIQATGTVGVGAGITTPVSTILAPSKPPFEFTEAQVQGWLADLKIKSDAMGWKRMMALRFLNLAGRVPPEWVDKVPPPLPADIEQAGGKPVDTEQASGKPAELPRPISEPATDVVPKAVGKPAPEVSKEVQARIRKLIDQLPGNTDPAIEATVCQAISEALSDRKPESLTMFVDLAGNVRRGGLAAGCLQEAFEAGCSRTARNRGAMFTKALKDSIRESRRASDRRAAGGTP